MLEHVLIFFVSTYEPVCAKEGCPVFVNESTDVFFPSEISTHSCCSQHQIIEGQLHYLSPVNNNQNFRKKIAVRI